MMNVECEMLNVAMRRWASPLIPHSSFSIDCVESSISELKK